MPPRSTSRSMRAAANAFQQPRAAQRMPTLAVQRRVNNASVQRRVNNAAMARERRVAARARVTSVQARAVAAERRRANAEAKRRILKSINTVRELLNIAGGYENYPQTLQAVRGFVEAAKTSNQLGARANAIFRAYAQIPAGAGGLNTNRKLAALAKIKNLVGVYSVEHSQALENAALRYASGGRIPLGAIRAALGIRGAFRRLRG